MKQNNAEVGLNSPQFIKISRNIYKNTIKSAVHLFKFKNLKTYFRKTTIETTAH